MKTIRRFSRVRPRISNGMDYCLPVKSAKPISNRKRSQRVGTGISDTARTAPLATARPTGSLTRGARYVAMAGEADAQGAACNHGEFARSDVTIKRRIKTVFMLIGR